MLSYTCAMRMPVTIASWCSVPSAPRKLVGAISPTYMGVKADANPAQRKSWTRDRNVTSAMETTDCEKRLQQKELEATFKYLYCELKKITEQQSAHRSRHRWRSVRGSTFRRSGRASTTPSDSRQWRQTSCLRAWLSSWEKWHVGFFVETQLSNVTYILIL